MIPNCAATRHAHFTLRGDGPAELKPPSLADWPELTFEVGANTKRVNLDTVTPEEVASWQPGDTLLLSGKMLTGRDAAHKRIQDLLASGEGLPERGQVAIDAIRDNKAVYLIAVGGAAYLVSKAIRKSRVVAFAELGMEAIHEFEVEEMPVTVAVDSRGESVHKAGPKEWQSRIGKIPVTAA